MDALEGRVAVITGAAQGQGAAEARILAEHGAHVVVTDLKDEGRTLAEDISGSTPGSAEFVRLDVTDEQDHVTVPAGTAPAARPAEEHSPAPAPEDDPTPEDAEPLHRGKPGFPAVTWGEQSTEPLRFSVTTPDQRSRLVLESGVSWEQLVRKSDELDFIELVYPPGSSSTMDGRMLRHDDYEYGILLEGELEVTLGFDVFVLHAGEAIGFDSTIPHLFRNPGTTPARGIWVMHHRHQ